MRRNCVKESLGLVHGSQDPVDCGNRKLRDNVKISGKCVGHVITTYAVYLKLLYRFAADIPFRNREPKSIPQRKALSPPVKGKYSS
jgi:hypothetical protein